MYYLTTADGKRTRFESLTSIFVFLEKEALSAWRYAAFSNIQYTVLRKLGESFEPKARTVGQGHEYTRNSNVYLFGKYDSLRGSRLSGKYWSRDHLVDGEQCVWLATDNKFIVLDGFGRVVSLKLLHERYEQRYKELHERNSRWSNVNDSKRGTKRAKNWHKRWRRMYQETRCGGDELKFMTSQDEFDKEFKIRGSRAHTIKALNEQYNEYGYEPYLRSWKDQSKKRKQWM
ncbi:hypothetical protein [Vibrio owensii]|uniref:hypothetical protein n=1 Tax=Vibrio owensii TaxID=696485 RepID=UPI003CC616E5